VIEGMHGANLFFLFEVVGIDEKHAIHRSLYETSILPTGKRKKEQSVIEFDRTFVIYEGFDELSKSVTERRSKQRIRNVK